MMLRGDARKRLNPEHLVHHDPAVCALIEAAEQRGIEQGRIEGWNARGEAIREDERRAAGVDL